MDYCQYYLYKFEYKSLRGKIRETYKTKDEIRDAYESSLCYLKYPDDRNKYLVKALSLYLEVKSKRFYELDADANKVLQRSINRIRNEYTYEDIFGAVTDFMWVKASAMICKKKEPGSLISLTDNAVLEYMNAMVWLEEIKKDIDNAKYNLSCMEAVDNLPKYKRMVPGLIEDEDVAWYADWHNISDSQRKQQMYDRREYIKRIERVNKYKNKLNSIAGFMEIKTFNPSVEFMNVAAALDDIAAYFERLHNELKTGTGNTQLALASIFILIGPYAYVVRRYSALFYYENDCSPPNYEKWVEAVSNITKDFVVKEKFKYYLRMNLDCSLEDVYIARNRALFNLKGFVRQIEFDHSYVLQHTKEEYLSIDRQLQDKIERQDYHIIDGHLCIEL